jgi:hypothetical protein
MPPIDAGSTALLFVWQPRTFLELPEVPTYLHQLGLYVGSQTLAQYHG